MVPPDVRALLLIALAWWCIQERLYFLRMELLLEEDFRQERERQEREREREREQEEEQEQEQEQDSSDEEEDLQDVLRMCRQLVLVLQEYAAQRASDQTSEDGSDSDSEDAGGSAGQEAPPPPRAVKRRRAAPPATRSASAGSVGSNLAAGSA
jgi:hypothetical protein